MIDKNLTPGWYRLDVEGVTNPHPDKRAARDWTLAATFPVGVYRITESKHEMLGQDVITFEVTRFAGNDYGRETINPRHTAEHAGKAHARVEALLANLVPHDPTASQQAVEAIGSGTNAPSHILDMVYELGMITPEQIKQAAEALHAKWAAGEA